MFKKYWDRKNSYTLNINDQYPDIKSPEMYLKSGAMIVPYHYIKIWLKK